MTTHTGCDWDYPDQIVMAYAQARAGRMTLAAATEDYDAGHVVLDELGDCALCLRHLSEVLAGLAGSMTISLAEANGQDRAAAILQLENYVAQAEAILPSPPQ